MIESKREPNWAELLFKNEGAQKVEGEVRTGDEGLPIPVGKDPSGLEEGELENKETGLSLNQSKTPTKVNVSSVIPDDHNVTAVRRLGERSDLRTLLRKEGEEALRIDQGEDESFTSSDREENWSRAERVFFPELVSKKSPKKRSILGGDFNTVRCRGERSGCREVTAVHIMRDLVLRLNVSKKLEKNYVKTVSFNADGNILVFGSQDKQIMLWDWETGIPKLTFESSHGDLCTGFRAKIMPYTDDRNLITFGGELEMVKFDMLESRSVVSKLGCWPNISIDLRTAKATELLRCQPIGSCSARNPVIPLEANGKATPQIYKGHEKKERVDCLSFFGPKLEFVVSGSSNGRVYIWKKKGGELVYAKKEHVLRVNCIEPYPHTTVLASSGADGIKIWTPNAIDKAMLTATKIEQAQQDMGPRNNLVPPSPSSSCSEANGKAIPQVYKGHGKKERVDSLSFFGPKSEFVVSGFGNGRLYIGKKKGRELVRAKKEHVLGVDCIESHSHTTVLARSGANGIKIWTPTSIDKAKLPTTKNEQGQQCYEHIRGQDIPVRPIRFLLKKHSFINSLWSPYLYAVDTTAGQNSGM
ncbi:hypothetical protein V6N13_122036 [Hibiscus sabdariffa]